MKKWFTTVRPPKYLRYLFFIAYSFYRRFISHRGDAHFTSVAFLAMIHMSAYQGIYYMFFPSRGKLLVLIILSIVAIQFYIWFWYKEKWKLFVDEFKYINRKQQLFGGIYLFIYLLISLFIGVMSYEIEAFFKGL